MATLKTFRTNAQGRTVSATCRDDLEPQAKGLLQVVAARAGVGVGLAAGVTFDFGGAPLRLRDANGELALEQPDYDADDPGKTWQTDLTSTLVVVSMQAHVIKRVGAEATTTGLLQHFTMAKGAGPQPRVYLHRRAPGSAGDSGWYLGPLEGDAKDYVSVPVYALLALRPALLQVLALPEGFMAVFEGDTIAGIANGENQEVWKRS